MERRKKLATAGAISLSATAGIIALASSVGLFGLTDDSPKVGKLSPIDSTQPATSTTPDDVQTIIVDDPATPPNTAVGTPTTTPRHAEPADDHGGDNLNAPGATTNTRPVADDDHGGDDHSGPGSVDSGHEDDNSGPGSTSSGHDGDDD
jgi:hypothetical protein